MSEVPNSHRNPHAISQHFDYSGTMGADLAHRWIWCSRIPSSGVQALAQDAENDVYLNVMSLAFPVSIVLRRATSVWVVC